MRKEVEVGVEVKVDIIANIEVIAMKAKIIIEENDTKAKRSANIDLNIELKSDSKFFPSFIILIHFYQFIFGESFHLFNSHIILEDLYLI